MCQSTVMNFYAPMREILNEMLEAHTLAQADIRFNVREFRQCNVKVQQKRSGWNAFVGALSPAQNRQRDRLIEENTPTHVRFIANEVPGGLFRGKQPELDVVLPLVKTGTGMAELRGALFAVIREFDCSHP
jgi:hypothetical protein